MRLKYRYFLLGVSIITCISTLNPFSYDLFECSLGINDFTNRVHRRFYFIERLKKTIYMLAKINEQIDQLSFLVRTIMKERYIMNYSFSHMRIQSSVEEIIKTKSLKPLFMIWDDFTIYKSLEDDLFVEEFTKEIFIVTKGLLTDHIATSPTFKKQINCFMFNCCHETVHETLGVICAITDILTAFLDNGAVGIKDLLQDTHKDGLVDVVSDVTSEDVLLRFYHIERLNVHRELFNLFKKEPGRCFKLISQDRQDDSLVVFDDGFEFSSPVVRRAIRQMERKKDIGPLLLLLDDLRQFKYIDNSPFVREVLIALFLAQKNYVYATSSLKANGKNSTTLELIVEAYNAIEDLPIEEILEVIDAASDLYKELVKEKENNVSWSNILNAGWIVRLSSFALLCVKIIGYYTDTSAS